MYENEDAAWVFLEFMNKALKDILEIKIVQNNTRGIEYRIALNGCHNTKSIEACMICESNEKFNHRIVLIQRVFILKDEPTIELSKSVTTIVHVAINIPPINESEDAIYRCLENLYRRTNPG